MATRNDLVQFYLSRAKLVVQLLEPLFDVDVVAQLCRELRLLDCFDDTAKQFFAVSHLKIVVCGEGGLSVQWVARCLDCTILTNVPGRDDRLSVCLGEDRLVFSGVLVQVFVGIVAVPVGP